MSKKETTNEVAVKQAGAVVAAGSYDYGADAGAGFEGTKGSDLSIPFLQVLQSNSPQVEANSPEGARAGMLFNTVSKELLNEQNFLPVHSQDVFVEWVKRDKGGGFVAVHEPTSQVVQQALGGADRAVGKVELPNGNELIETHYVYGLLLDDEGQPTGGFAVLAFTSTKIKVYRDWKTAMYMVKGKPPMFAFRARISTVKQKNEKGTFFNFEISPLGNTWVESLINPTTEGHVLQQARDFRELVVNGVAKAAFETQNEASGAGGDEVPAGKAPF